MLAEVGESSDIGSNKEGNSDMVVHLSVMIALAEDGLLEFEANVLKLINGWVPFSDSRCLDYDCLLPFHLIDSADRDDGKAGKDDVARQMGILLALSKAYLE